MINGLNGGPPLPTMVPPRPAERGVRRRPTLVLNVETLAHIALIARHGPSWFRQAGTPQAPGTALVTVVEAMCAGPVCMRSRSALRWPSCCATAGLVGPGAGGPDRRVLRLLAAVVRPRARSASAPDELRAAACGFRSGPASSRCCRRTGAAWPRRPGCWATSPARSRGSAGRARTARRRWRRPCTRSRSGGPTAGVLAWVAELTGLIAGKRGACTTCPTAPPRWRAARCASSPLTCARTRPNAGPRCGRTALPPVLPLPPPPSAQPGAVR